MTDSPQAAPTRQLLLRRAAFFTVFALVVAGIIGVTLYLIYRSSFLPRHDAAAVAPNVTVKALVSFPDDRTFPDGLALAPGGTLYLTLFGTGAIDKIDSTGKLTPFITDKSRIVSPGAILVAPDNMIYVLDYTLSEQAVGTLKKITPDGAVSTWGSFGTDQVTLFGALALDAAENLYVTTGDRQVWRFSPDGKGVVWWTAAPVDNAAPQTTGIAYDAGHNAMIIGDTGTGSIYRVSLGETHAGDALLLFRQKDLKVQGITIDEQGRVWLTNWVHDSAQLQRLEVSGVLNVIADGFRAPTGLVYNAGKVYVVNSDLTGLVAHDLFGILPSPLRAKPPFTVDVVEIAG